MEPQSLQRKPLDQPQPELHQIASSPEWYLYDCNAARLEFQLLRLDEEDFRQAIFLDSRLGTHLDNLVPMKVAQISKAFPGKVAGADKPAAYIFHIGHCGSTLLSRALSETDRILPLREPRTLQFLANQLRELNTPRCLLTEKQFQRLGVVILSALERRFNAQQLPLIKATSVCNNLIGPILQTHRERKAILLYQPLEPYLAGRFKRTVSNDLRVQAQFRFDEWQRIPGAPAIILSRLGPAQLGSLAWLTSMWRLLLVDEHISDQIQLVDFQEFLGDPQGQLTKLAAFIGIHQRDIEELLVRYPEVSSTYSKDPGMKFSSEVREKTLQLSRQKWSQQISKGLDWAQDMIRRTPELERCADYLE
jgi:hypothetical protein